MKLIKFTHDKNDKIHNAIEIKECKNCGDEIINETFCSSECYKQYNKQLIKKGK